ncbi:MAG: site-specific integrase, partial [bacterium]
MKITKVRVEGIVSKEKDVFYWDDSLTGFGVKVTPKGWKSYVYQYRLGGRRGRVRRVYLGVHGSVTTEQARRDAVKLAGEVAGGRDVASDKRSRNAAPKVSEVVDVFLKDHVEAKLKPSTRRSYECLVRLHVGPVLGNLKIDEVSRSDVAKFHHRLKETPYHANRALAFLSKLMSWVEKRGYRTYGSNPCIGIEKFREKKRERFLNDAQLHGLGMALTDLERSGRITEHAAAAIRLLLITGCRLREILHLKWDEIDFERHILSLGDSKTGQRSVLLSEPALEVLEDLKRIEGNPYVCCGKNPGQPIVNLMKVWRRVCNEAELRDVRLHDLRHTHASVAASAG